MGILSPVSLSSADGITLEGGESNLLFWMLGWSAGLVVAGQRNYCVFRRFLEEISARDLSMNKDPRRLSIA
jgi:hypothetical protein